MAKRPRTFQCPDDLWEQLTRLAQEREVSADAMVAHVLRQMLRMEAAVAKTGLPVETVLERGLETLLPIPERQPRPTPCLSVMPAERARQLTEQARAAKLRVAYQGRIYPVQKETFLIGRGENCDLRIDAPNIELQHAVVSFEGGRHLISDMSSSGIGYRGGRVMSMPIEDGDLFALAGGHQLRFRFGR